MLCKAVGVRGVLKTLSSEAMRAAVMLLLLSCVSWTLCISNLRQKTPNALRLKFVLGVNIKTLSLSCKYVLFLV